MRQFARRRINTTSAALHESMSASASASKPHFAHNFETGSIESSVGICRFANASTGFQGIHKQRYSDFIVREVDRTGRVCHLVNTSGKELEIKAFEEQQQQQQQQEQQAQQAQEQQRAEAPIPETFVVSDFLQELGSTLSESSESVSISEVDLGSLATFLGQCLEQAPECPRHFTSALRCNDKAVRTSLHQLFRKHASKQVETDTVKVDDSSYIRLTAKHHSQSKAPQAKAGHYGPAKRRPIEQAWPPSLGDYLQFTLCKENVDTMSAVNFLGRMLHVRQGAIEYAGTKDKRAVTAQTCTIYRKKPSDLARVNRLFTPYLLRVGDFAYVSQPAKLGDLGGNRFSITLRALNQEEGVVLDACRALERGGFINYFGLQRFGQGSGSSKSHDIGRAVFKSEWRAAVDMLFNPREGERGEIREVKDLYAKQQYREAARKAPVHMHGERLVLEGLNNNPNDFSAAFTRLPKLTRLICCHAYQSYLWNKAASRRIEEHGLGCVEGDLVAVGAAGDELDAAAAAAFPDENETVDEAEGASGDVPGEATTSAAAQITGDAFQSAKNKSSNTIRLVTRQEAESNAFSIRDVVLPLVGSDALLPSNSIGAYYQELLSADGLSLQTFSTCSQTYRMTGAYRRLLQFPKDLQYKIVRYDDPNAELAVTELTAARDRNSNNSSSSCTSSSVPTAVAAAPAATAATSETGRIRALMLSFTLPPGTYATMLLRELTKESTETQFQAQLTAQEAVSNANPNTNTTASAGVKAERREGEADMDPPSAGPAQAEKLEGSEEVEAKKPRLD